MNVLYDQTILAEKPTSKGSNSRVLVGLAELGLH